MTRALIVDDDPISRAYLRNLLKAHPAITTIAEAATLESAREWLEARTCDLVFLDVALGDGSGFDLMPNIPRSTRVICVSGHSTFALRAFEVDALDYLVKPVRPRRLAEALSRRTRTHEAASLQDSDVIHLRDAGRSRMTRIADICAIEAQENYTRVHHREGWSMLVRRALKTWEEILPSSHFQRIHRTGIVNLTKITRYSRDASGGIALQVLALERRWPVGRTFWRALKARLSPSINSSSPFLGSPRAAAASEDRAGAEPKRPKAASD